MKRIAFAVILFISLHAHAIELPLAIPLWPHTDPAIPNQETIVDRSKDAKPDRSITKVTVPDLTVFLPPADQNTGAAIIICPGGGYGALAIDKEGYDVARWLNTIGVAGIVLKYRMPRPDLTKDQTPWPLLDAWRAVRLVRSRAVEWKIDPAHVGMMGFSAGGHLASTSGTHFDPPKPDAADPLDRLSARPDFLVLLYPVITFHEPFAHIGSRNNFLGKTPDPKLVDLYSNEQRVTKETPPTLLIQAKDDSVKVENSISFEAALKEAGVKSEIILFEKGGHGFGLGGKGGEPATWPGKCAQWLKAEKLAGRP